MRRWLGLLDQDNSVVAGIGGQVIRMRRRSVSFAWTERRILQGAAARTLVGGSGWLLACPHEPDVGRREGSLVKSAAALELLG